MKDVLEMPPEVLDARVRAVYVHAYGKVAAMEAVYQVRGLKPGQYTQALPNFENESDWCFWKETESFDEVVDNMNFAEFKAYLLCISILLEERGYGVRMVPISQMRFIDYFKEVEQGG